MNHIEKYEFICNEATEVDRRWSNADVARFHSFNPNGLAARKQAADERIWELVDAGIVNIGSVYSRGSLAGDDRCIIELAKLQRVSGVKLAAALQRLEEACESAEQFIAEAEAKAAPAADLASELADVCEVDRKHRGYELTFDDGSARRVKTAAEARLVAAECREAQAESACDQLARMSDDEIAVALNDVRQCRQVIHSRLVKNELTDEEHAFARDAMEDLWHEIYILEMEQSSRAEAEACVEEKRAAPTKVASDERFNKVSAEAESRGEKNDCSVRSLALALDIPYEEAWAALDAEGRKPKRGALLITIRRALTTLGVTVEEVDPRYFLDRYPKPHNNLKNVTTHHPDRFESVWRDGQTYLMATAGHILAVKDGVNLDWTRGSSKRAQVIWRLTRK